MDCRLTAPYSLELEPDIVLTEPQPRHRTPPAWMILCTPGVSITLHSVAAFHCGAGSITLHWVAELIVFSTLMRMKQIRAHCLASFV